MNIKNTYHRFGCMLRFNLFTDKPSEESNKLCDAFGGKDELLRFCANELDSVELHTVKAETDPKSVLNAVKELNKYGISATIHGSIGEKEEFFAPYQELFSAGIQEFYNITVHPAKNEAETERMLRDICAEIEEKNYPAFITLENQRMKSEDYFGICKDVTKVVRSINSNHLGTCFDFGHQLSNARKYRADKFDKKFITLVRHTHIHSLFEGSTHFPLDRGETALTKNLDALLDQGYTGVFSLELAPDRYIDKFDIKAALISSVHILKAAVAQTVIRREKTEYYTNDYFESMKALKAEFDAAENCAVLIGHSGYLLKFGRTKIAVDVALNVTPVGDEAKIYIQNWVKDFDAYIVTHAHVDHYDPNFVSELPENIRKFIPDFIDHRAINIEKTFDRACFNVGDLNIKFFESGHSRENSIVPEYGFCIEYKGESYIFPTDVRNYHFAYPKFKNPRILFAHLWLGKGKALILQDNEYTSDFCQFVKSFGAKENYVAHLHDVHRTVDEMWSEMNFEIVKKEIEDLRMFRVGEIVRF